MNSIVQRGAIAAGTVAATLAGVAGVASAATVRGTVIHHNSRAHSFVVATRTGQLYAIHASRSPRIGSNVVVVAKRLHDGTYRLQHEHAVRGANARKVRVRGVVTWSNPQTGSFVVSSAGVSLLVVHHAAGRSAHTAGSTTTPTTPSVGSEVVTTGTVDGQGELSDQNVQTVGQDTTGISLEGTVLSVDPTAQTITVSADDSEQSGASITVSVPSTFNLAQFTVGEEVELMVQPTGTGTATLLGSADDGNAQAANNQSDNQGQNPASGDGGDSTDQTDGQTQTTSSSSGSGSQFVTVNQPSGSGSSSGGSDN